MITDFGTKRKRKIRLLIQIVKNRSFISRKAEKSDSILKKWRKAKFVKCLKTAKMQSCVLKFWSLSQKEYFTNRSQRVKVYSSKTNKRIAETVSLHGAEVPGRPMREGARCAVIAKRHALANTKFCRHFVFSRNSDIPGSHLQSQYINIKQISFTLYVRLCRGEQNSSLLYRRDTLFGEDDRKHE
jgi:hypothetical protein